LPLLLNIYLWFGPQLSFGPLFKNVHGVLKSIQPSLVDQTELQVLYDQLLANGSVDLRSQVTFLNFVPTLRQYVIGSVDSSGSAAGVPAIVEPPRLIDARRTDTIEVATVGGALLAFVMLNALALALSALFLAQVGAAVRNPAGARWLSEPLELAEAAEADVVVEALGGTEPARAAIAAALRRGASVVTANKAVLAAHGAELEALARTSGARLLWSAAAGGSMPLLALLGRLARGGRVHRLDAVLNGTTNFVLDEVARGAGLADALESARRAGLAERDAGRDLSGRDAADKLVLAAHAVTGRWIAPERVAREPLGDEALARVAAGDVVRQVASLDLTGGGLVARVRPRVLSARHPLARVAGAANAALVTTDDGVVRLAGLGAGRWPASQAVLADLLELARAPAPAPAADPMQIG